MVEEIRHGLIVPLGEKAGKRQSGNQGSGDQVFVIRKKRIGNECLASDPSPNGSAHLSLREAWRERGEIFVNNDGNIGDKIEDCGYRIAES